MPSTTRKKKSGYVRKKLLRMTDNNRFYSTAFTAIAGCEDL